MFFKNFVNGKLLQISWIVQPISVLPRKLINREQNLQNSVKKSSKIGPE